MIDIDITEDEATFWQLLEDTLDRHDIPRLSVSGMSHSTTEATVYRLLGLERGFMG